MHSGQFQLLILLYLYWIYTATAGWVYLVGGLEWVLGNFWEIKNRINLEVGNLCENVVDFFLVTQMALCASPWLVDRPSTRFFCFCTENRSCNLADCLSLSHSHHPNDRWGWVSKTTNVGWENDVIHASECNERVQCLMCMCVCYIRATFGGNCEVHALWRALTAIVVPLKTLTSSHTFSHIPTHYIIAQCSRHLRPLFPFPNIQQLGRAFFAPRSHWGEIWDVMRKTGAENWDLQWLALHQFGWKLTFSILFSWLK